MAKLARLGNQEERKLLQPGEIDYILDLKFSAEFNNNLPDFSKTYSTNQHLDFV